MRGGKLRRTCFAPDKRKKADQLIKESVRIAKSGDAKNLPLPANAGIRSPAKRGNLHRKMRTFSGRSPEWNVLFSGRFAGMVNLFSAEFRRVHLVIPAKAGIHFYRQIPAFTSFLQKKCAEIPKLIFA